MANLINTTYQGVTITVTITGLPITITGEVLAAEEEATDTIVTLKLTDGKIVSIASSLIAFFF